MRPVKAGADDALDDHGLAGADLAARMVDGQPAADARTCGAAIHLTLGKDADVAAVGSLIQRRSDKDGAIEKAQVLFKGMRDGPAGHDRPLDGDALFDDGPEIFRCAGQADVCCLDVGVERAAKGQVVAYLAQARHLTVSSRARTKEGTL